MIEERKEKQSYNDKPPKIVIFGYIVCYFCIFSILLLFVLTYLFEVKELYFLMFLFLSVFCIFELVTMFCHFLFKRRVEKEILKGEMGESEISLL